MFKTDLNTFLSYPLASNNSLQLIKKLYLFLIRNFRVLRGKRFYFFNLTFYKELKFIYDKL